MENVNESCLERKMSLNRNFKKNVHHSLKNGWFVLRYSVLFRITYEIENLIILTDNLERFAPRGIFQRLLKRVLRLKSLYAYMKKVRILLLKKMIFDEKSFYQKRMVSKTRMNRHQRKLQKSIEKMPKQEVVDNLKRAYDIQHFLENVNNSNQNFNQKCQTILSEKLK